MKFDFILFKYSVKFSEFLFISYLKKLSVHGIFNELTKMLHKMLPTFQMGRF
jgi:hypothetical protein